LMIAEESGRRIVAYYRDVSQNRQGIINGKIGVWNAFMTAMSYRTV